MTKTTVTHAQLYDMEDVAKYGATAVRRAKDYVQTIEHSFIEMLSIPSFMTQLDSTGTTQLEPIVVLPGVSLTSNVTGPSPHRIMMIGCWPNKLEENGKGLLKGEWVNELINLAEETSFPIKDVYYTTLSKIHIPGKKTAIPKEVVADFMPLLIKEIELVQPEIIILLGSKVLKAIMGGHATLEKYRNITIDADKSPLKTKTAVMMDFSAILAVPEFKGPIQVDMIRLTSELKNQNSAVLDPVVIDYKNVYTLADLEQSFTRIEEEYSGWVAVDCEWGGGNYLQGTLRSIQFSWEPGKAIVAVFTSAGLVPTELGNNSKTAWEHIKRFIENGKTRIIGHFIRADLPWIQSRGVDIRFATLVGWDTALAGHLLDENWAQGLEVYTARHTPMGRYELPLSDWIKETKYDVDTLGYGGIPDEILLPYAAQDADATFRIFMHQFGEMNLPENKKIYSLFEEIVMRATLPILEIEMTGMTVDIQRLELLAHKYTEKKVELENQLRILLNWPDFNPDAPAQKAAAMFGWVKPGSKTSKTNPPTTATLNYFEPIKTTTDRPWPEVMKIGNLTGITPSTDRSVLNELILNNPDSVFLDTLLLYTAISQTVKSFTGELVEDSLARTYDVSGGLLPKLWCDGKAHTRIRQTLETGRYGHSDPNMAQLPKTAEDLVGKAFKESAEKIPSIRSCFMAEPGWCLIDCDWVQAELYVMAWLSGDISMQTKLKEPGSDFHSEVAIEMFRLESPPSDYTKGKKEWLKETGNSKYRTIAKTITFGIAYGRGALAIKKAVYLEKVNISVEEAQEAIDKFKSTFPELTTWLYEQQNKSDQSQQAYVENGFGRRRRFCATTDKEVRAHQRRQAMNAPIQGTVGDLMSLALVNLFMIREVEKPHLQYKILMSVHDQVIITCPITQIEETLEVMQLAMCDRCKIPNNDLALEIDGEVCIRWSEALTEQDVTLYPALAKYVK